jgi:hypothetical protein
MKNWIIIAALFCGHGAGASVSAKDVLNLDGKFAFQVFKNTEISKAVHDTLTAGFIKDSMSDLQDLVIADFDRGTTVQTPSSILENRYLALSGCENHNCPANRSLIIIDSQDISAVMIVRKRMDDSDLTPQKEAQMIILSSSWSMAHGSDLSKVPPGLRQAIADL